MSTWQLQDAKARFSEVVNTAQKIGPQIITRRGVEAAVVVSMAEWRASHGSVKPLRSPKPKLSDEEQRENKSLLKLLQSAPKFDIPPRGRMRMRKPMEF